MAADLLVLAAELKRRQEPFALATVVRCERPTSAKPGAKALVRSDGSVEGWVGGACAEPVVVREALLALRDGQPRLIALVGEGSPTRGRAEGMVGYPMSCHSGGTLEIYVEPFLPKSVLLLVGHGPVVEALEALAKAADFDVVQADAESLAGALERIAPVGKAAVVVATHGNADEDALARVLAGGAAYVSLIASRRRAAVVIDTLRQRGVSHQLISRLKAPAGLDIGAVSPEEIAISILAEIVQFRRSAKPAEPEIEGATTVEAIDPVCGMTVDVATAGHRAEVGGRAFYFCCAGCRERFGREPARYVADLAR